MPEDILAVLDEQQAAGWVPRPNSFEMDVVLINLMDATITGEYVAFSGWEDCVSRGPSGVLPRSAALS